MSNSNGALAGLRLSNIVTLGHAVGNERASVDTLPPVILIHKEGSIAANTFGFKEEVERTLFISGFIRGYHAGAAAKKAVK